MPSVGDMVFRVMGDAAGLKASLADASRLVKDFQKTAANANSPANRGLNEAMAQANWHKDIQLKAEQSPIVKAVRSEKELVLRELTQEQQAIQTVRQRIAEIIKEPVVQRGLGQSSMARMDAVLGRGGGGGGGANTKAGQSKFYALGGAVGQASFAVQDFTSILEMGGKNSLGRALMSTTNNVQMLGAAFGPWGLAVSAAAGALATILIPKLFEADKASEKFAEGIDKAVAAQNRLIDNSEKVATALRGVGKVKSEEAAKEGEGDARFDIGLLEDRLAKMRKFAETALKDGMKKGRIDSGALEHVMLEDLRKGFKTPIEDLIGMAEPKTTRGLLWDSTTGVETSKSFKKISEDIRRVVEDLSTARKVAGEFGRKAGTLAIDEKAKDRMSSYQSMLKDNLDAIGKQADAWADLREKITESTMTPLQKYQAEIVKIADMLSKGIIDEKLAELAVDKESKDFMKGKNKSPGGFTANRRGSSEAAVAIQEATRNRTDKLDKQIEMGRKLLEEAKKQTQELKQLNAVGAGSEDIIANIA